jgi:hypothetical protein
MNLHNLFCKYPRKRPDPLADLRHDLEQYKRITDMKLSQLSAALDPLISQVGTIATDVAALKANQTDPELPTGATDRLTTLATGLQAVADLARPA